MNEKETKIIELERRDPQSESKYWNQKYIETVLKLFEEKEKNKKLKEQTVEACRAKNSAENRLAEMQKYYQRYKLAEECFEQTKVIDMMAEDISNTDMFPWNNINSGKVREHYFKKARGEENE